MDPAQLLCGGRREWAASRSACRRSALCGARGRRGGPEPPSAGRGAGEGVGLGSADRRASGRWDAELRAALQCGRTVTLGTGVGASCGHHRWQTPPPSEAEVTCRRGPSALSLGQKSPQALQALPRSEAPRPARPCGPLGPRGAAPSPGPRRAASSPKTPPRALKTRTTRAEGGVPLSHFRLSVSTAEGLFSLFAVPSRQG